MIERVDGCPGGVAATAPTAPRVVTVPPLEFELALGAARARFRAALRSCTNPWHCPTHGKEVVRAYGELLAFETLNRDRWFEEAPAFVQALPHH